MKTLSSLVKCLPKGRTLIGIEERDLIVVIDVSPSMLERDLSPSRLHAAKDAARALVSEMRKRHPLARVGILGFGGIAITVLPLTAIEHTEEISQAIESLDVIENTNIASALVLAEQIFKKGHSRKDAREILLLTDGGHNQADSPHAAAKRLLSKGCIIRTRGIGRDRYVVNESLLKEISSLGPDNRPLYEFHTDLGTLVADFRSIGGITR